MPSDLVSEIEPGRCAIVVDQSLPVGRAANAAAVIALTMGKIHPDLAGVDLIDGSGLAHPGLIPIGISVLGATAEELKALREKATSRAISRRGSLKTYRKHAADIENLCHSGQWYRSFRSRLGC